MHPAPKNEIQAAAARWLARRDAGFSPAERAAFELWLQESPAHAAAWRELDAPWRRLDQLRQLGLAPAMMTELAARAQRRRLRVQRRVLMGLAAAAVVTLGLFLRPAPEGAPLAATQHLRETAAGADDTGRAVIIRAEVRVLADGSVVELNDQALVNINYTAGRREVHLISGDAHFTVVADAARPFVVKAGAIQVRAVGTAFAVERAERAADVVVTEGRVGVDRIGDDPANMEELQLTAGHRVVMPYAAGEGKPVVEPISAADLALRLQWRGPRLRLSGATLAEAVTLLNQLNRVQLTIADPTLAELRFSGTFRADNAEGFVRLLESNYGVEREQTSREAMVLRRR